jgi:circadian clock protein KaiC
VIKVRGSAHSKDVRFFDIEQGKTIIGDRLAGFSGVLSGQPVPARRSPRIKKRLQIS